MAGLDLRPLILSDRFDFEFVRFPSIRLLGVTVIAGRSHNVFSRYAKVTRAEINDKLL